MHLPERGGAATTTATAEEAQEIFTLYAFDMVLADYSLPGTNWHRAKSQTP